GSTLFRTGSAGGPSPIGSQGPRTAPPNATIAARAISGWFAPPCLGVCWWGVWHWSRSLLTLLEPPQVGQQLQYLVAGRDHLAVEFERSLSFDQVDQRVDGIGVGRFEISLLQESPPFDPRVSNLRSSGSIAQLIQGLANGDQPLGVDEACRLDLADVCGGRGRGLDHRNDAI